MSALDETTRTALLQLLPVEDLPRHAYYGDSGAIEPEVLERLRDAYEVEKIVFEWERGDVLLLDNMQFCHTRQAFRGPRKVLIAMADAHSAATAARASGVAAHVI